MIDARIVVDSSANMAGEPAVYSVPLKNGLIDKFIGKEFGIAPDSFLLVSI